MMNLTEQLVQASARAVTGGTQVCVHPCRLVTCLLHTSAVTCLIHVVQVEYQGLTIDLGQPFRRASMHDLVQEATGAS